jgi:hypothetical protein
LKHKRSSERTPENATERKAELLSIFSNLIGREEVEKGLSYEDGESLKAEIGHANERVIAKLTEDEQIFFRLMVYISDQNLVAGGEHFRLWITFWSIVRARYGFTKGGDLGVRHGTYLVLCG